MKIKYHSLDEISQKEFLGMFKGPLKELLYYAKFQGIKVEPLRKILKDVDSDLRKYIEYCIDQNRPCWVSRQRTRTIYVDIRDLELNSKKGRSATVWVLAHEIVHIEGNLPIYCSPCLKGGYSCPFNEYHCHEKGLELIKELGIPVNETIFWDFVLRFVGVHSDFCPEFKNCDDFDEYIKKEHKSRVLFWRKRKEKYGGKRVLKKYLLE